MNSRSFEKKHELMRSVSVDCVLFGFHNEHLQVLLVERTMLKENSDEVLFSDHTLAGYHIFEDEDLDAAAARIVKDLSGLEGLVLEQFSAFGSLTRIEQEKDKLWLTQFGDSFSNRIISVGYYSLLPTIDVKLINNNREVSWHSVDEVNDLGYDHEEILKKAIDHLRYKLRHEPVGFELLPTKFTLSQMQKLYEAVFGVKFDKRNFRKKVAQMKYVVPLDERQTGVAHKPAQLFMFSRDVHEKTKRERIGFFI